MRSGDFPVAVHEVCVQATKYCPRCAANVLADAPWPHWRKVRAVYVSLVAVVILLGPILAVDYCVMIPSAFIFMTAWGPLNGLVAEKPTCRTCGGIAEDLGPPP